MQRRRFIQNLAGCGSLAALVGCSTNSSPVNLLANNQTEKNLITKNKRIYIDGLSFVPEDTLDVKASQVDSYIADISAIEEVKLADGSVNYKRTYQACMKSIKEKNIEMKARPDIYHIAQKGSDIAKSKKADKCAVFLQIQGADCVEGGLEQVDEFYQLGLRVLQLTHHYNNLYAGGALSLEQRGLSRLGLDLIDKLENKHMLIDLSHSSVASASDTLKRAKGPVVQTHGAARAIINNARCTPDHILKGIADSGGVFGVFMMSWWLTNENVPRPEHYISHLKHLRNVAGIDAVAIANDYPLRGHKRALESGNNNAIAIKGYDSWWQGLGEKGVLGFKKNVNHIVIPEFNHIKRMRSIEYQLSKARFSSSDIDKIMGENWQRVLVSVLG
jgi:membrane dipeptidase